MMKTTIRIGLAGVLGLALGAGQARADLVIDQQNTTAGSSVGGGSATPGYVELAQSFTPTTTSLDFATFSLYYPIPAGNFKVEVLLGAGTGGTVLGISSAQALAPNTDATYQFDFAAPVGLIPGLTYTLAIVFDSGNGGEPLLASASSSNPYSGGSAYSGTNNLPGYDLVFSEGSHTTITATPEPGTIAMAASALPVGLVVWLSRRRARPAA